MAALLTGKRSNRSASRPFTAKVFLGRLCERIARAECRRIGWRVRESNWRFPHGEIDLLAEDRDGRWIVVEVRGYQPGGRETARVLPAAKRERLHRLSARLGQRHRRAVRVEFFEVRGKVPRTIFGRALVWALAAWRAPGFECRRYQLD